MAELDTDSRSQRVLTDVGVASVRLLCDESIGRNALRALGLPWAERPGELAGDDLLVAWSAPRERLVFATTRTRLLPLLDALRPGLERDVVAVDLSEARNIVELTGSHVERQLRGVLDASALPRPGGASTCRFADVIGLLVRPNSTRWWLVVERPLLPYVLDWLAFTDKCTASMNLSFPGVPANRL